jgi:signal transduction histidine kinase
MIEPRYLQSERRAECDNAPMLGQPTETDASFRRLATLARLGRDVVDTPDAMRKPAILIEQLEGLDPPTRWCWAPVDREGTLGRLLHSDGRLAPAANRADIAENHWRRTPVDTGSWVASLVIAVPDRQPRLALFSDTAVLSAEEIDLVTVVAAATAPADETAADDDRHMAHLRMLGEASGGLVHELKSPLGGILSTLTVLRRRLADDPRSLEVVGLVEREVERLRDKVVNILGFIRADREPTTLGSLQQVIHQAVAAARAELDEAGVTLDLDLSDQVPTVMCDIQPMRQAIQNLLTNAREAMTTGGHITVQLRADTSREPPGAVLTVSDSGPGFPDDLRPRVFEPFVTSKTLGTGLGLANVARIVGDHGGDISAHNGDGGGAVIAIHLPLVPGGRP